MTAAPHSLGDAESCLLRSVPASLFICVCAPNCSLDDAGSALLCSVPAFLFSGMLGGQPAAVSRFFGVGLFSITNLIFIFESLSTLDSTFTSAAKLFGPEFAGLLEDGTPKPPQRATLTCAPCA